MEMARLFRKCQTISQRCFILMILIILSFSSSESNQHKAASTKMIFSEIIYCKENCMFALLFCLCNIQQNSMGKKILQDRKHVVGKDMEDNVEYAVILLHCIIYSYKLHYFHVSTKLIFSQITWLQCIITLPNLYTK